MVIKCPKCNKLSETSDAKMGKKEICEHCEHIYLIDESVIYQKNKQDGVKKETKAASTEDEGRSEVQKVQVKSERKRISIGRIIIWVFAVVIVIFIALWIIGSINRGLKEAGGEGIIPRQTYSIINKGFKLAAGEFWYTEFRSVKGARLIGSVLVPDYDVNVFLIKGERELRAFKNNDEFYCIQEASAQKITEFQINCLLDEGTYYLVVDNRYSVLTAKRPSVKLSIEY